MRSSSRLRRTSERSRWRSGRRRTAASLTDPLSYALEGPYVTFVPTGPKRRDGAADEDRRAARRGVWALLAGLALALALAGGARAQEAQPDREDVYLTLAQALRQVLPEEEAPSLERADVELTAEERPRVERRLGTRLGESAFVVRRGLRPDGSIAGYAVVTEEVGKYRPITFIVAVAPEAKVKEVAVMVYRESHGAEVKRRRFLAQFRGKGVSDPIRQNRDILNISGATLSVRSVARGVRKVLCVVDEVLLGPARRASLAWKPERLADLGPGGKQTGMAAPPHPGPLPPGEGEPLHRAGYLMGTILEALAHPEETAGGAEAADRALAAAFGEVARLERLMTTFDPSSELSRVNRYAARRPVAVSPETLECVERALEFARRSDGAFDPTLRPDGWKRVRLDRAARTIAFAPAPAPGPAAGKNSSVSHEIVPDDTLTEQAASHADLALDLGGIAKGYALDRAAAVLRAAGVRRALLNFGGQVLALDPPPGEAGWVVAVEDPRARDERALGFFEVANGSVSTSSQVERSGHIRDPRTGAAAAATLSATVHAPSACAADALSTAAFVLGPERGGALVATEPGAEALLVAP